MCLPSVGIWATQCPNPLKTSFPPAGKALTSWSLGIMNTLLIYFSKVAKLFFFMKYSFQESTFTMKKEQPNVDPSPRKDVSVNSEEEEPRARHSVINCHQYIIHCIESILAPQFVMVQQIRSTIALRDFFISVGVGGTCEEVPNAANCILQKVLLYFSFFFPIAVTLFPLESSSMQLQTSKPARKIPVQLRFMVFLALTSFIFCVQVSFIFFPIRGEYVLL